MIAVDSLVAIKEIAVEKLAGLGYQYWQDNPDTEKNVLVKGMPPFGEQPHAPCAYRRAWLKALARKDPF